MSMTIYAPPQSIQPLGTNGDQRSRLLLHQVPLAVVSAIAVALFMGVLSEHCAPAAPFAAASASADFSVTTTEPPHNR